VLPPLWWIETSLKFLHVVSSFLQYHPLSFESKENRKMNRKRKAFARACPPPGETQ